ncbi:fimbrial protein [Serratia aquatilis]|uniref:Fimbrial protein n=1 Tax=Serratia aquatilis TaxID=1737515 RepID=A0ABV6EE54_9GAMM
MKIGFTALIVGLLLSQSVGAVSSVMGDPSLQPPPLPMDSNCSLSIGGGVVDYGRQSRWQMQSASTGGNALTPGKRTLMLNVVCPYTQQMRLALRGDLRYGQRGTTVVRLLDVQLDGHSVQVVNTTPVGAFSGAPADAQLLQVGQTVAAVQNGQLAKGKVLSARLEIEPTLPESEARVAASQISESILTFELVK